MNELFYDADNSLITRNKVRDALLHIGAADCQVLFIHSDVMFGTPAPGFKRKDYLATLYEIIESIGVPQIIVPTFTYSFCNHEDFDIISSKTSMGVFNEYVRKLPDRYRTDDPLLSLSVPESLTDQFSKLSTHSLGSNSGLDRLHQMEGVKFLFFGAEMAECFTYVHYVEKMLDVPYRFDMSFEGDIIREDGIHEHRKQYIHTQCTGVKLPLKYLHFENEMEERGYLKKQRIGEKCVACISEKDAFREIRDHIHNDPFCFVDGSYNIDQLIHKYTFSSENGRITHC